MGELLHTVEKFGGDALAITALTQAGRFAARVIIQGNVVAGHIDASCAVDPACEAMVVDLVKKLAPLILPLTYAVLRATGTVIKNCSNNPDGGLNKSISATLE